MNSTFTTRAVVGIGVAGSLASVAALFVSGGNAPVAAPAATSAPSGATATQQNLAPAVPVQPTLAWLAGSWVPAGESCFTDAGWRLSRDLAFSGDFLNGLWELAGDELTIDWHSVDEDAAPNARHGVWRYRVTRTSQDQMVLTGQGETKSMRRCAEG